MRSNAPTQTPFITRTITDACRQKRQRTFEREHDVKGTDNGTEHNEPSHGS
jgi:hypothetical protein